MLSFLCPMGRSRKRIEWTLCELRLAYAGGSTRPKIVEQVETALHRDSLERIPNHLMEHES